MLADRRANPVAGLREACESGYLQMLPMLVATNMPPYENGADVDVHFWARKTYGHNYKSYWVHRKIAADPELTHLWPQLPKYVTDRVWFKGMLDAQHITDVMVRHLTDGYCLTHEEAIRLAQTPRRTKC